MRYSSTARGISITSTRCLLMVVFISLLSPLRGVALGGAGNAVLPAVGGNWVGVLEYRDYSEPATSAKRVYLPTWLTVTIVGKSMDWQYTYDDGPNKVFNEMNTVVFDTGANTFSESSEGKSAQLYSVNGYETLKDGLGALVLFGRGSDNDKPAEIRITMTIKRNLLEIAEDVRPDGSTGPFAFRHLFRFTRSQPPAVTGGHS